MKLKTFKECNITYAEHQPPYLPLPAHRSRDGEVTACWGLSFRERLKVLITGRIFLQTLTFNRPLQPLRMFSKKPNLISDDTERGDYPCDATESMPKEKP